MKLSSFKMPRWWQAMWRSRYPMPVTYTLYVTDPTKVHYYGVRPMRCGCGYRVTDLGGFGPEQDLGHRATLASAIRMACKHAKQREAHESHLR